MRRVVLIRYACKLKSTSDTYLPVATRLSPPDTTARLTIGAVAKTSGLTVEAIRYYERLGLLPSPGRTPGGRRIYTRAVLTRLTFIDQAKALGLTLAQIADLLNGPKGVRSCRSMYDTLTRQLREVDERIATLQQLRATLEQHQRVCAAELATSATRTCPTWTSLECGDGAVQSRRRKGRG
jgi:DNA-binding transcriptional MerR regulator